jgi:ketosteroid isomerase-like protein
MDVIARWKQVAKAQDAEGLADLLAPDVVFHSPVVHTPQRGRAITHKYLSAAFHVLFNETFRYVGEWRAERSATLEFVTTIEGIEIDGVDIIAWDEAGRIVDFKVMVRPLKAINLLHRLMAERLAN